MSAAYTLAIILNSLFTGLYVVLMAVQVRKEHRSKSQLLAITHFAGAIFLAFPFFIVERNPATSVIVWPIAISVLSKLAAKHLHLQALTSLPVGPVSFFSYTTPFIALILAALFINEIPGTVEMAGTFASVLIILYVSWPAKKQERELGDQTRQSIFDWFCAALSAALNAVSAVALAYAVKGASPITISFYSTLAISVAAAAIGSTRNLGELGNFRALLNSRSIWLIGAVFGLSHLTHVWALSFGTVGLTLALGRLNVNFQVLFAYFLLGEKDDLFKRMVSAIALVLISIVTEFSKSL